MDSLHLWNGRIRDTFNLRLLFYLCKGSVWVDLTKDEWDKKEISSVLVTEVRDNKLNRR